MNVSVHVETIARAAAVDARTTPAIIIHGASKRGRRGSRRSRPEGGACAIEAVMNDLDSRHLEIAEGVPAAWHAREWSRADTEVFVPGTTTAPAS
jgi:hypothetical protein